MFSHLHVHTPYSFLDGASDIEMLVREAASQGMPALAMTDHNSVAAAVKFVEACRGYGIKPILGAEVTMEDDTHLTLLARDRAGYAELCRLLTLAYAAGGRLTPRLPWEGVESREPRAESNGCGAPQSQMMVGSAETTIATVGAAPCGRPAVDAGGMLRSAQHDGLCEASLPPVIGGPGGNTLAPRPPLPERGEGERGGVAGAVPSAEAGGRPLPPSPSPEGKRGSEPGSPLPALGEGSGVRAIPPSLTPHASRLTPPPLTPAFSYDRIPFGDPQTFRMFRAGAAVGSFQFESAAQMALAATLQQENFEDLVAAVALIRPGPIRGNVVKRFVACRNGWARADVLHPSLADTLAKTYGCIVFQEQVNDVVAAMTGCSDAEADRFRKKLKRHDKLGRMDEARQEFVDAALARHADLTEEQANLIFDQIEGWSGYGFIEGHAASFALIGYRSAYLSVHHPAPYYAGLMNHQPMGYFSSNTLAGEARRRGVRVLPVDINRSEDKCYAEEPDAIRLGLRVVTEMREQDIAAILAAREEGPFASLVEFCGRVPLHRNRIENLVLCGAFDALHEHRRGLLWRLDETIALALAYRDEGGRREARGVSDGGPNPPAPFPTGEGGEQGAGLSVGALPGVPSMGTLTPATEEGETGSAGAVPSASAAGLVPAGHCGARCAAVGSESVYWNSVCSDRATSSPPPSPLPMRDGEPEAAIRSPLPDTGRGRGRGSQTHSETRPYAEPRESRPSSPLPALGEGLGVRAPSLSTLDSRLSTLGVICLSGCRRGLVAQLVRAHRYEEAKAAAIRLRDAFGRDSFYIELQDDLTPDSLRVNRELASLADHIGVGVVATNNVHYAKPDGYVAHDMLRCVAGLTTVTQAHPLRPLNAERYLKTSRQMAELFAWRPDAIANTLRIAEQCECALPDDGDVTPAYPVPEGHDAASYLRHLTYKGGKARYGTLNEKTIARIEHELSVITQLGYADYFLMVWDIVRWTRRNGIRCTGRGSAADSCVAYCLYLTDVEVISRRLPFARFLAPGKMPDIDMDFPSERRDDVFRHIIERYGAEHVGMVCTFHTFWAKSAVRDIGKVLELPLDALSFFSERLYHHIRADRIDAAFDRHAELREYAHLRDRFQLLFDLCGRIAGFPRHIGTHSSGIVISRVPLSTIAPLQPSARGITQIWTLDKDDAETIGAIKFDVLSLRILSAVGDAERGIRRGVRREAWGVSNGEGASRESQGARDGAGAVPSAEADGLVPAGHLNAPYESGGFLPLPPSPFPEGMGVSGHGSPLPALGEGLGVRAGTAEAGGQGAGDGTGNGRADWVSAPTSEGAAPPSLSTLDSRLSTPPLTPHASHLTPALPLGSLRSLATPVAWDLEDFSAWDKFLWTWRITGICAECHVFTYLRDHLRRWGILTAYEAMQAKHNTRVTVAGLNVRPHRPPTRSGEPVIFTLIEDESGLLHATIAGEAIDTCTSIFLTSPAVIVRGLVKRQGRGAQLLVEKVKPLRMAEMAAAAEDLDSIWERPWKMGANVLTRMVDAVGTARAADTRSGVGAI